MKDELMIEGVVYVRKDSIAEAPKMAGEHYVVRGERSGVFAGEIVERIGREVTMRNARRLWYWDGAASLSQLAVEGVKKPQNCKFPIEIPELLILDAIEVIAMTQQAVDNFKIVPVWKQ